METVHSRLLMADRKDPCVSILKWGTIMWQFKVDRSITGRRSHVFFGTRNIRLYRTREKSHCWPSLWPPSTTRRPRPAGGLGGCSWPRNWCTDGWAEVFEGKLCPPHPWQCWWLDRCLADSSTVGQSLPGEPPPGLRQRCPAEEAEGVVLAFLRCAG